MIHTDWKFSLSSEDAWNAMYESCDNAKHSIDFEQFIFSANEIGLKFLELFERKAREGVRVRLLCDTAGSFSLFTSGTILNKAKKAGVEIRFFNQIKPWRITRFKIWFFRNHRKLLVVDREIGFIGGVGIDDAFKNWRDTHVKVMGGDIITEMQSAFDHMWWVSEREKFVRFKEPHQTSDGFRIVTNAPHFRQRHVHRTFLEIIRSAEEYVYLTTPYFVPDSRFFRVLRLAARRRVDVRILIPDHSDHPYVDLASCSYFQRAFDSKIRIYRYKGRMLHAKTMVVDGRWSSVGSSNVDNLSSFFNHEANLVSVDTRFAEDIRSQFADDLKNAVEISPNTWDARGSIQKVLEFFCAPFGRFF